MAEPIVIDYRKLFNDIVNNLDSIKKRTILSYEDIASKIDLSKPFNVDALIELGSEKEKIVSLVEQAGSGMTGYAVVSDISRRLVKFLAIINSILKGGK